MTCRCGYQFCYVCGADWSPPHYQNHDQNGVFVPPSSAPDINIHIRRSSDWRPAVMLQPQAEEEQEERRCCGSMSRSMCLTLPLRIIAALVLFSLLVAAFGVMIFLSIIAIGGRGKSGNRSTPRRNKEIDECLDNMWLAYLNLYPKTC
jgi:hypothetical protein